VLDILSNYGFTGGFTAGAELTATGLTGQVVVRRLLPNMSRLGANY
jgi:hypothetical protein